ncbi:MAG: hypothetical protein IKS32_01150 [Solobacterium sp.]|nr:hypothetical protein [Solobacterium sp.]
MKSVFLLSYDVLMKGSEAAEGASELIKYLYTEGYSFLILTDESLHTRNWLADRMYNAGFPLMSEDLFYTTTMGAVDAIRSNYPTRNRAFCIGSDAMRNLLEKGGFTLDEEYPQWLFIGDQRNISFREYSHVLQLAVSGASMITVSDSVNLWDRSGIVPGPAAVTAMLETASGNEALVSGWSSSLIIKKAMGYIGAEPEDTVFVSNNLEGEISTAILSGIDTIYVTEDNVNENLTESQIRPTYVVSSLRGLFG